jgi:uncharacterized protein YggE
MKPLIPLLILSIPPAGLVAAEPELKGSPTEVAAYLASQQIHATLAGEAEVKVPADRAVVTLRLSTEHKSLKEASLANQQLRASLTAYLAENGIGAERVQSAKFASTPRTGIWSDKVKSYKVESQLEVTVLDDKQFQIAAGAVDKWSDVTYAGVKFEHSEKEALRIKAIRQACENAMARKKTYEEALGVKLAVKRFIEAGTFRPMGRDYPFRALGVQGGSAPSYAGNPSSVATLPGMEEPTTAFGELVFKAHVTIECALEAR